MFGNRIIFISIVLQGFVFGASAQHFAIQPELQTLRSTHHNLFSGGSLSIERVLSPVISMGMGVEYASASYHEDNTWKLHRLRFVPVFLDCKIGIKESKYLYPYIQISQGISFIKYLKQEEATTRKPYEVSESGYYVYGGLGANFKITRKIFPSIGIGIKSFHVSTNVLEVNPHGLLFRAGCIFRPGVV